MRTRRILISLYTFYNMRYSSAGESGSGRKGKGFMQEYTLKTKFAALKVPQANEYLMDFGKIIEKAFEYRDSRPRLLGNLLVLECYCNTVQRGLEGLETQLFVCLRYAQGLLWDYLGRRVTAADFQDFANDYYAWFSEKGVEHNDAPKGFCSEHFAEYFADSCPDPYEWVAVEWSCDLLMQLVSIEGGRVDYENFEECGKLDLDWVPYMLEIILETVCERLASAIVASNRKVDSEKSMIQVHNSLAQKIVKYVQNDLQMALLAAPAEYEALRNYFNMDSDRKRREYGYGRINSSVC
ncbi:MAG: hypothetical protein OSJ73_08345 [Lachnospiraceae bacterium]|nr:hypothetical protein [Lachnospiraceae bacterium]